MWLPSTAIELFYNLVIFFATTSLAVVHPAVATPCIHYIRRATHICIYTVMLLYIYNSIQCLCSVLLLTTHCAVVATMKSGWQRKESKTSTHANIQIFYRKSTAQMNKENVSTIELTAYMLVNVSRKTCNDCFGFLSKLVSAWIFIKVK